MFSRLILVSGALASVGVALAGEVALKERAVQLKAKEIQVTLPPGKLQEVCATNAVLSDTGYSDGFINSTSYSCELTVKVYSGITSFIPGAVVNSRETLAVEPASIGDRSFKISAHVQLRPEGVQFTIEVPKYVGSGTGTEISASDAKFLMNAFIANHEEKIRVSPKLTQVGYVLGQ